MKQDQRVAAILAAARSLAHVRKLTDPHQAQLNSLRKRCRALGIDLDEMEDYDMVDQSLAKQLTATLNDLHAHMLADWRAKVRAWKISQPAIHRYVKNDAPSKTCIIRQEQQVHTHPIPMSIALHSYWNMIESWPPNRNEDEVWLGVEDKYAMFLPRVECEAVVSAVMLKDACLRMRPSMHGCDGWSLAEARKLPIAAFKSLVSLFDQMADGVMKTPALLGVKRRTPVEKTTQGIPTAADVRPIDIYSTFIRAHSSALCAVLKPWLKTICHDRQSATQGGVLWALTRLACWSELVLTRCPSIYCVTLDMTKMYNMLSPTISKKLANVAGLSMRTAEMLAWPLELKASIWKLPNNGIGTRGLANRGLAQGLAASVLLAEVNMAALARKLDLTTTADLILYVDDIHIITTTLIDMRRALVVIVDFVHTLALSLSVLKSCLWGTEESDLAGLSQEFGIPKANKLYALGATWPISDCEPGYLKEKAKIALIKERLDRVAHLPSPIHLKAQVISTTCLSIVDYLAPPVPSLFTSLRASVRRALKISFGAPEIVMNAVINNTLDPWWRAVLSIMRIWAYAASSKDMKPVLESMRLRDKRARLGFLMSVAKDEGWTLNSTFLQIGEGAHMQQFTWANGWGTLRKRLVQALKDHAFRKLQQRRGSRYQGDMLPNWQAMMKLLQKSTPLEATTLIRIWGGVLMTGERKYRLMGAQSAACCCGAAQETLEHIMWECPILNAQRPLHLMWWSTLAPACTQVLLCPRAESNSFARDWVAVCKWALKALSLSSRVREHSEGHVALADPLVQTTSACEPFLLSEAKGHFVMAYPLHGYVVCMKCFVARRSRDSHFLIRKDCAHMESVPLFVGETTSESKITWLDSHWRLGREVLYGLN